MKIYLICSGCQELVIDEYPESGAFPYHLKHGKCGTFLIRIQTEATAE